MLVAGFVGYTSDTIRVESGVERVDFRLSNEGVELEEVVVNSTLGGNYVKRDGILKGEMISFAGLCKMACCNLAESFENSASVTVGYSDAISGARQIKMLGLAGTYTQILDENRPIMRGLSAPYGLSYTPGMWLNSPFSMTFTPISGSPDVLCTFPVTVSCANAHETFIRKRAINKANGLSLAFFNCTLHINLDFLKVSFYQILI